MDEGSAVEGEKCGETWQWFEATLETMQRNGDDMTEGVGEKCPPARLGAHRGFPPLDELCVELCSDRWSTGLVPSALRLCGVLGRGREDEMLLGTMVA